MRSCKLDAVAVTRGILCAVLAGLPFAGSADMGESQGSATRDPKRAEDGADAARSASKEDVASRIVYVPPIRGSVKVSVGGGIRSGGRALPEAMALAPEHVAQTALPSPTLVWHLDSIPAPDGARITFTLLREDAIDPLVERELSVPERAGVQRISLAELGVELEPDIEYEWAIALVRDGADRSGDSISLAGLRRVDASVATSATHARDPAWLAKHSLWYDALAQLQAEVEASPDGPEPRARRDAPLRQAGLTID